MSKNKPYDIHKDFKIAPVFTFSFHPVAAFCINTLLKVGRYFQVRNFQAQVSYQSVISDDGHAIKLAIIRPHDVSDSAPVIIYYHGGAFMLTYAAQQIKIVEQYALASNAIAIVVDYRLAPKNLYPVGFNDCYEAYQWVLKNAKTLNINPRKIAVAGDSAGGAMAISVAMRARDEGLTKPCGQMLIYPVLDSSCSTKSATDFVDVPLWNARSNQKMWAMYLKNQKLLSDQVMQYGSPIDGRLEDLPTTYIESAEFDPLRDESHKLAGMLKALGITTELNKTKQTIHAFDCIANNQITQDALLKRKQFLKDIFNA